MASAPRLRCAQNRAFASIDIIGFVKVLDFGLASIKRESQSRLTATGTIMGTAAYMSPEQCKGRELTAATDIYSLGVVLYRMLAGERPYDGEDPIFVKREELQLHNFGSIALGEPIDSKSTGAIGFRNFI